MPLFPTEAGGRITKTSAVATIVEIVSRLGTPTRCDNSGGQLYGGHSLRTGGAQYLAGLGVDPLRIQAMGRWRSSLVIRYSCNKGAHGITADTVRGLIANNVAVATPNVRESVPGAMCPVELDKTA